ncbi:pentatricopeptide repeat-containing protein At2g13600 [Impatiens glandulifera]|uniref:pentatricopeptide repeat-containing protein At2g13600 n=1 Tax=Impatiens glandulifera TaxID=253017 RepID=UPI001FB13A11|nr:pentatricopeptide repeat-containing protein At2g13600 [Impatiens glandulifera]
MGKHAMFKLIMGDLSLPNSSLFAKMLDSCLSTKSPKDVRRLHARITKSQFSSEVFIQNRLIDVYGKCGCLEDAHKLFDRMPQRNTFTWNAIITALSKSALLDEAERLFDLMPDPDQCSWNSMVSGFSQHGRFENSLDYFVRMHKDNFVLNEYSFGSSLSSCAGLMDVCIGMQIHAALSKSPHSSDVYMGSALLDMYGKSCSVASAQKVFDEMRERNTVSWNSLISCYEQNGPAAEAISVFVLMMGSGFDPDEVTLASVVSACASLKACKEGRQIHARSMKLERLRSDHILSNTFVDMYAKCGRIVEARRIFDRMENRNVVSETSMMSGYAKNSSVGSAKVIFSEMADRNVISWNALISGYTQNGENEKALDLFRLLKRESVCPTHYTFGNLLNACANLTDLELGRQAHAHVLKHRFLFHPGKESNIFVGNSLIDMYMKCGSIEDGRVVFKSMSEKDWVTWNALIVGYAQNGKGFEALDTFKRMMESGEKPDHVTMIGVLSACSHAGLIEEGRRFLFSMKHDHGLEPLKDHYSCIVDLLGRAGRLHEARDLIESMPMEPDSVVWGSMLSACKTHGDIELGKYVAEKLLEIDPGNSGSYVLLSNMYSDVGRWKEAMKVRKLMKKRGVVKQPGCSWIEIKSRVHVFMVKDGRHPQRREIYLLLRKLTKEMRLADDLEMDFEEILPVAV